MAKTHTLAALMLLGASGAFAQAQFYVGAGLGVSDAFSDSGRGRGSINEGILGELGLTTGLRFNYGPLFFGPELDADFHTIGLLTDSQRGTSCAHGVASSDYICDQGVTARLRGVVGANLGSIEVFGTVGYAAVFGGVATSRGGTTSPLVVGGLTYGVGIQRQLARGMVRAEYIRDVLTETLQFEGIPSNSNWAANTFKVSYIVNFSELLSGDADIIPGLSFYAGGGLVFSQATSKDSDTSFPDISGGAITGLSATLGMRYDLPALFFGAEADLDVNVAGELDKAGFTCDLGSFGPYFCSQNATVRLRGVVGKSFGKTEVFGTLGYGIMNGNAAIGLNTDIGVVGGLTYSVGAQYALGSGKLRMEFIRDDFTNIIVMPDDQFAPTWRTNSVKVSYLLPF